MVVLKSISGILQTNLYEIIKVSRYVHDSHLKIDSQQFRNIYYKVKHLVKMSEIMPAIPFRTRIK